MSVNGNGVRPERPVASGSERAPRRIVLLEGDDHSAVRQVLLDYPESVKGSILHAEVRKRAAEQSGAVVAAEWFGPLGWTRFLWCKR